MVFLMMCSGFGRFIYAERETERGESNREATMHARIQQAIDNNNR
jgi:hypothetical protein